MRVLVASEAHFLRSPRGEIWSTGPEDYSFWSSYRSAFDEVGVLARAGASTSAEPSRHPRADGPAVQFHALDDYRGPWQYLARLTRLRRQVRRAAKRYDAFILRAPGAVAYLLWNEIRDRAAAYAVEVLGDPWESLAPGRVRSLWRPAARFWSRRALRRLCRETPLACYVTQAWLQQRYPPGAAAFSCSDARVVDQASDEQLAIRLARMAAAAGSRRPWELGILGSLETRYKAVDIHLRAIRICLDHGANLRFSVAGDGRERPNLERLAAELKLAEHVRFLGALPPGRCVDDFLDGIDLFLLASHTEGLPRALAEAMARGCPAIASAVGGIPELLPASDLVPRGDAVKLAAKILSTLRNPGRMVQMARRNLAVSKQSTWEHNQPTRDRYLRRLQHLAAECI